MPELPDLQVFSQNLSKELSGKKLETINVLRDKKLNVPAKELKQALEGAKLDAVERNGKELRFKFSNGNILGLHLMLKGRMYWLADGKEHKHPILELVFENRAGIVVTDYMKQATPTLNPKDKGGMDALAKELTPAYLKKKLAAARTMPIKTFLMDQKKIKGIGNAYADEILWEARIAPLSKSSDVPDESISALVKAIKKVLTNAEKQIRKHHPDLITGEVRDFLKIHNPHQEHSPTGASIVTDEINGRKTYYTAEQKLY